MKKKPGQFLVLLIVLVTAVLQLNILTASAADRTGWVQSGNKWYFYDADGDKMTGWLQDGGKWYFLDNRGAMKTGWVQDGGKRYYFDGNGIMQTGWLQQEGKWYCLSGSGAMQTGWVQSGGKWYYLDSKGVMLTGWQKIDGRQYYLDSSGVMKTGWLQLDGRWYYLTGSGVKQTGWLESGGNWYYLDGSGVMQTGWVEIDGKKYYLNSSGVWKDLTAPAKNATSSVILPDLRYYVGWAPSFSGSYSGGERQQYSFKPAESAEKTVNAILAMLGEKRYQLELIDTRTSSTGSVRYDYRYTGTGGIDMIHGQYDDQNWYSVELTVYYYDTYFGIQIHYSKGFELIDPGKRLPAGVYNQSGGGSSSGSSSGSGWSPTTPEFSKLNCLSCDGDGDCNTCGGDGYTGFGSAKAGCYTCHGNGKCRACGGSGKR